MPREILEKPASLTPEEFTIIKSHVYYTKYILDGIEGFEDISRIAGNHHERLDGNGYANGVRGEELSLYERVMAICDVYQALTEERPYRKPDEPKEALRKIN